MKRKILMILGMSLVYSCYGQSWYEKLKNRYVAVSRKVRGQVKRNVTSQNVEAGAFVVALFAAMPTYGVMKAFFSRPFKKQKGQDDNLYSVGSGVLEFSCDKGGIKYADTQIPEEETIVKPSQKKEETFFTVTSEHVAEKRIGGIRLSYQDVDDNAESEMLKGLAKKMYDVFIGRFPGIKISNWDELDFFYVDYGCCKDSTFTRLGRTWIRHERKFNK